MKRPSFQFYPSDWLRDTGLRVCSVAARGLWIDMICHMHEGNPYGYLKVNQKVILPANLAVIVGVSVEVVESLFDELEEAGVFSRDDDGDSRARAGVCFNGITQPFPFRDPSTPNANNKQGCFGYADKAGLRKGFTFKQQNNQ